MSCGCGKKKCNGKCGISPSVLQINNNECTLFHKVEIPAVMGDETTNPPKTGAYRNVLLYYEASGNSYLYSSDGIPTKLTGVVSDYEVLTNKPSINGVVLIKNKTLADLGIISAIDSAVADEATARANADNALSDRITTNANNIAANATAISNEVTARTNADNTLSARISGNTTAINNEKTARENADTALSNRITANANAISAETTARENADNALSGRITANADAISGEKTARENADAGLQDQITAVKATADSAVQPDDIDKTVMSDLAVDSNSSTAQVILKESKVNLKTGATSSEQTSLPVASSSQAGVMNSATYDAVTSNTSNINAIMNGAVAITGLPANPSQSDLTTAWQNETGLSTLINRASVYDVTNNKVWTYYTNDTTWHAASNTSSVTVNTFTNSSEGTIKGSTNIGQVFAENDGTGSVNGWDALSSDVANAKSKLSGIQSGAEVNVQSDWSVSDSSSDAYIKNKPTIGNGTLTIQKNGTTIDTFTANSTTNKTVNITVPTVNDATLTIQKNGDTVQTFTANSSSNKTANIEVPTKTSELDNDAGFIANDTHQVCGEGGNITLDTTTFEPLEMNHLGGNTEQNGTPTPDAPVAVQTVTGENVVKICGKNLLDIKNNLKASDGGLNFSYSNDKLVVSGTPTRPYANVTNEINTFLAAGQYTLSLSEAVSHRVYIWVRYTDGAAASLGIINAGGTSVTTTFAKDVAQIRLDFSVITTGVALSESFSVQLEKGSSASSFEPYQEQSYEINLGKNLFDKSDSGMLVEGYLGSSKFYTSSGYWTYYIPCLPNTTYTASRTINAAGRFAIAWVDGSSTFPANSSNINGFTQDNNASSLTITTGADAKYIAVWFYNANQAAGHTLDEWKSAQQCEKGSTATSYAPYFTPIELCKIGTYQDYIYKSDGKWHKHAEIAKIACADISWTWDGTVPRLSYNASSLNVVGPASADTVWLAYSNKFKAYSFNYVYTQKNTGMAYSSSGFISLADTTWADQASAVASVQDCSIYYALATPTDTEITNEALVAQLEALWEADGYDSQTNIALTYAEGNAQGILSVCQYPSHLPVATKSKLGTIIVGHGLDIEDDGRLDVIVDSALSDSSINPVQNKAITTELNSKADISSVPTKTSQLENDSGFVVNDTTEICDEGSDITLNGTLLEPLDVKKIEGNTEQQTYSGKNLLNTHGTIDADSLTGSGVSYTINADGTISTSGSNSGAYKSIRFFLTLPAGTYKFSGCPSGGTNNGYSFCVEPRGDSTLQLFDTGNGNEFTLTEQKTIRAYPVRIGADTGVNMNGKVFKPMITVSTAEQTYEPYVGGTASPNPDYPQAVQTVTGENVVKICGKNLLYLSGLNATDNGVANTLNNDGSITCSGTVGSGWNGWTIMPYVSNLIQAGEYTLSIDHAINVGINITFRDSSNTNIVAGNIPAGSTSATVTLPRTAAKYSLWVNGTTGTAISFTIKAQLVAGSTPDYNYEPYQGQSYEVNLGNIELCRIFYDTTVFQDYIYKDGDDWKIHKATASKRFSGADSEGWVISNSGTENFYYRCPRAATGTYGIPDNSRYLYCNYESGAQITTSNTTQGVFVLSGGDIRLRYGTEISLDDWKAKLAANNMVLTYALATPTDTEITNEALVAQLEALWEADGVEGETNIFTVSDGVNERAVLSVCQYPSHLPIATKTKLGTVIVGHGLDIEEDGKLDVIVDDDFSTESEHPIQNKVITNALAGKADNTDLSTVAMTGSYDDLTGKPTIPTVNNATLTIQKNGTSVATFTANSSTNVTANITAPVVTMTTTDPGEGGALAANNFIGVYV